MTRRGHRKRRDVSAIRQLPWQQLRNPYAPIDVLDEDQVERIVEASLTVLETTGFRYLDDASRDTLTAAGGVIATDEGMTRLDRDFVSERMALAPASFQLHARNPQRTLEHELVQKLTDKRIMPKLDNRSFRVPFC